MRKNTAPIAVILIVLCTAILCALAGCSSSNASSSSSQASSSSSGTASSTSSASSSSTSGSADTYKTVTMTLNRNAGTGYEWIYEVQPEGALTEVDHSTASGSANSTATGGPLTDTFTFRAAKPGEATVTFKLARSWESDAAETQVFSFTIDNNLNLVLNPYKSNFQNEPTLSA